MYSSLHVSTQLHIYTHSLKCIHIISASINLYTHVSSYIPLFAHTHTLTHKYLTKHIQIASHTNSVIHIHFELHTDRHLHLHRYSHIKYAILFRNNRHTYMSLPKHLAWIWIPQGSKSTPMSRDNNSNLLHPL